MKTNMDVRTLGERESNYTNSSVRQMKQKKTYEGKDSSGSGLIAAGLLAGAGVGVLAGMLLAPKKGKDLRKQVSESASRYGTKASGIYNSSRDKVTSWTDKYRKNSTNKNATNPSTTPGGRELNNDPATSITM